MVCPSAIQPTAIGRYGPGRSAARRCPGGSNLLPAPKTRWGAAASVRLIGRLETALYSNRDGYRYGVVAGVSPAFDGRRGLTRRGIALVCAVRRTESIPPVESPPTDPFPAEYPAYFRCFNAGRYFEAHEVLEGLWLRARGRPEARFYQGLIQLAGAFVHLQNGRPAPALALLCRCREHLAGYPGRYLGLDLDRLRGQIAGWLEQIQANGKGFPAANPPVLLPPKLEA